jgi:hypothetical protein
MSRVIEKVIILGSGESILELTPKDINYINSCKTVIAVNKFGLFYKKSGIIPTHFYFHDRFENNFLIFKKMMSSLKLDKLENLTIITNKYFKLCAVTENNSSLEILKIREFFGYRLKAYVKKYILPFRFNKSDEIFLSRGFQTIEYPNNSTIIDIKVAHFERGGHWAKSLNEVFFHFRGSLTSVLNFCAINNPNEELFLVGNDFYGSKYFYEKELDKVGIDWKDYTFDKVKSENIHYSFQNVNGVKMTDKFPEILNYLDESNNKLYCNNKKSLLVKNNYVKFKELIS